MKLSDLKTVFAPLTALGRKQITVHVADTPVVLRLLSSSEQIEVNSQMSSLLENSGLDTITQISQYAGSESMETLSRSIVKVGSFDLSEVSFIETEDKLPDGTPISIPKVEAVKQILSGWNSTMLSRLNEAYQTFLTEAEEEILSKIVVSELDIDTEIAALKSRVTELELRKAKTAENLKLIQAELQRRKVEEIQARKREEAEMEAPPEVDPEQLIPPTASPPKTPFTRVSEAPPPMASSPHAQAPPAWASEETFVDPNDLETIAAANEALLKKRNPRFR